MRGLSRKVTVLVPSACESEVASGMLDSAVMCDGTRSEHVNVALRSGSSQHGKALRASIGSN